ncbi:MAG: tetratricopeptide repeat protein [Bdellovibrionales bacterium]|jgi:hypothetical protein
MHSTNSDSLIQEVDDDLAHKQMEALWKRYSPFVIGGALMIIAATAGITGWKNYKTQAEQKATQTLVEIVDKDYKTPEEKIAAFESYAKGTREKPLAVFAKFEAAALALEQNKRDEAIALYDGVAADTSVEPLYRALADLFAVQALLDSGDPAALEARLTPLMKLESPWHFSAYEFAGYLALRTGDKEKARKLFAELKAMPETPTSMAMRASDILQWLGEGK